MYKIINHPNKLKFIEFYNRNNFHVILSNYGASIYQIDSVDKKGEMECITLSPLMAKYFNNNKYCGLTVGRVAGRIKDSTFLVGGRTYKIEPNEKENLLHSGRGTFAYKFFDFEIENDEISTTVIFKTEVKDMEDGFPGNLTVYVIYTLFKAQDGFDIEFKAICDKDTLLNITNHTYFNLSGNLKNTVEDHFLKMNKESYALMDDNLILKEIKPVSTEYDFRGGMEIKTYLQSENIIENPAGGYDHAFTGSLPLSLILYDKRSGRELKIESTYHDVLIYTNNYPEDYIFLNGVMDRSYLGVAIEPSRYTKILSPLSLLQKANALYDYVIKYRFGVREE